MINTRLLVILITLAVAASVSAATGQWVPLTSGNSQQVARPEVTAGGAELTVKWTLDGYFHDRIEVEGNTFDRVSLPQSEATGVPGSPELPLISELISVPSGYRPVVQVISAEWEIANHDFTLYPLQYPTRDVPGITQSFLYTSSAYNSVTAVPSENAIVGQPVEWSGMGVSALGVVPFRYYPLLKQLQVARSMTVQVKFVPGGPRFVRSRVSHPDIEATQAASLLNPPLRPAIDRDAGTEPVRMLVIVNPEKVELVQPLVDLHHKMGLRSLVWSVQNNIQPVEIKETVRTMYDEGLEYVLIVGDGYSRDPDVPMYFWDPDYDPGWKDSESIATHSDQWYVCLGPQQMIRDTLYDDNIPDLAIGRFTYDNDEQLVTQLDKTINYINGVYHNQGNAEAMVQAYMVAGPGVYTDCKESIIGFGYHLPSPVFHHAFDREPEANNQQVIDFINGTGVGFLNYRGHGNATLGVDWHKNPLQSIGSDFVADLNNVHRPFIYISSACYNGNIATYGGDCLIESFQKSQGASVAAHGSVISTYTDGNSFFDEQMYREWFDEGNIPIGKAAEATMAKLVAKFDLSPWPGVGRMNTRAYIWLGDPTLEYRFTVAKKLTVDIPQVVEVNTDFIEFTVTSGGLPIGNAQVCLRSPNDSIFYTATTDTTGWGWMQIDPPINTRDGETLLWTVYSRDGLPVSGEMGIMIENSPVIVSVKDFQTNTPVSRARVAVVGFGAAVETDTLGRAVLPRVPIGPRTFKADADGYLEASCDTVVQLQVDMDTLKLDLFLRFGLLASDSAGLLQHLKVDSTANREFSFTNRGNGPLQWSARLDFGEGAEPFSVIKSYTINTNDRKLRASAFVGDRLYIAGSNNNADPNYIYVFNRDGLLVDTLTQPFAGSGIFDFASEGDYLWCAGVGKMIYKLDLNGTVIESVTGPFNDYNKALAIDPDGNLWVGRDADDIYKIDRAGNILDHVPNTLTIRGIEWNSADPEYPLFCQIATKDGSDLFKIDPTSGANQEVSDLKLQVGEALSEGLAITGQFAPPHKTLVGTVNKDNDRFVRIWDLSLNTDWVHLNGDTLGGVLDPNEMQQLSLTLNALGTGNDILLTATLVLENNGKVPRVEIPVTLTIGSPVGVDNAVIAVPTRFDVFAAYPNPFNSTTIIPVNLPGSGDLNIAVYDLTGRQVAALASGHFNAGHYRFTLQGRNLASGIYLVRTTFNGTTTTGKIALVR